MGFLDDWERESKYSTASGRDLPYVVLQVTLKEKFLGTGSGNLEDLEEVINNQFRRGYRLLSMSTSNGGSKGFGGGDRIQATLVFEKMNLEEIYLKMHRDQQTRNSGDARITPNNGPITANETQQKTDIMKESEIHREPRIIIAKPDEVMFCDICGTRQSKLTEIVMKTRRGPQTKKVCDSCIEVVADRIVE